MMIGSLSAHVQWFSCQNDRADYHDIINIKQHHENLSVHKREGSIKGEVQSSSRSLAAAVLLSGCLDIHFRVFY